MSKSTILARYEKLVAQVETVKDEHSRAKGRLDELMANLKSKHGCSSMKAAEVLLKKLKKQETKLEKEFADLLDSFEKSFEEDLDE